VYPIGVVPVQVPVDAVRTEPTSVVPLMEGGVVFRGGCAVAPTTAVGSEAAVLEPPSLEAVTRKRSVKPTSAAPSKYVCAVAPLTDEQLEPALSQRCHWYAYEIGAVPVHDPLAPFKVDPWLALPLTVGRLAFEGAVAALAAAATTAVCADVADLEPNEFVAVTTTRIVPPTSAAARTYVAEFAPGTDAQPDPAALQRRHS
jgi:hypothetical protein